MNLMDAMIRDTREKMRDEAGALEAVSARLKEICLAIPAPGLEELHAMETGEIPLSLEALWISMLAEHSFLTDGSVDELVSAACRAETSTRPDWFCGRLPAAKMIAHLRGALRGRTLPENFRPEPANAETERLLKGQFYVSRTGVALVSDLLVKGYTWGG